MKEFLVVEAEGSPYEIGFAHGSKAKEKVEKSFSWYRERFIKACETDWDSIKNYACTFTECINKYDPDILEEIKGIADGSGLGIEEILAVNIRTELLRIGKKLAGIAQDGCTSFAVLPELTETGDTIQGQNWDWNIGQRDSVFVLKIRQKNKPDICMVTEGGLVGKIGFNSCGIGTCFNALMTSNIGKGVPAHVILRGILNSENLEKAIMAVYREGTACSANYLIGSSEGEAVDVEADHEDYEVLMSEDGLVVHANHFTSPRLLNKPAYNEWRGPDSLLRHHRIKKLFRNSGNKISMGRIMEIMKDHLNYPNSICRHEEPDAKPGEEASTLFSVIMNLNKKEMYAALGQPCCNDYARFTL